MLRDAIEGVSLCNLHCRTKHTRSIIKLYLPKTLFYSKLENKKFFFFFLHHPCCTLSSEIAYCL